MAVPTHSTLRQSLLEHPYKWTRKKFIIAGASSIIIAAIIGGIQVSLRYDSNESERWWAYYFYHQLISWGHWVVWIPMLLLCINASIQNIQRERKSYLFVFGVTLTFSFVAATTEGMLWHIIFNNAAEWPWGRVWKAHLSNRFGFHFLMASAAILLLLVRQLFIISKNGKEAPSLLRVNHNDVSGSLIIKHKGHTEFIPLENISHLSASGSYVEIYSDKGKTIATGTLKQFSTQLPSSRFVRIHRSFIVSRDHVQKLISMTNEDYKLITTSGHELRLSRSYKKALPILMGSIPHQPQTNSHDSQI